MSLDSMRFDDHFIMEGISRRFNLESHNIHESGEPSDVVNLLPPDPFDMEINATTFTAITSWFDSLEMDALNYIWNSAIRFPVDDKLGMDDSFDQAVELDLWLTEKKFGDTFNQSVEFDLWLEEKEFQDPNFIGCASAAEINAHAGVNPTKTLSGSDPHEAIPYVLRYLGVNDLLSVGRVCKSLHSAVQNDPLLWMDICIDQPLNEGLDDVALLQVTSRAQGNLQSLSLIRCSGVTDDGLIQVLRNNPRLEKLCVPGCTKLSVEVILNTLKELKFSGAPGLKLLRIGGLCDVTRKHFEELKLLLGMGGSRLKTSPTYYGSRSPPPCSENVEDRVIDIEVCQYCENPRLLYDCPIRNCLVEQMSSQSCRGCIICIRRCVECGRCVNDGKYVETFCLDRVCLECDKQSKYGADKETECQSACG